MPQHTTEYGAIEIGQQGQEEQPQVQVLHATNINDRNRKRVGWAMGGLVAVVLTAFAFTSSSTTTTTRTDSSAPFARLGFPMGKPNTTAKSYGPARNCTLAECKLFSTCDATVTPFVCVKGFAKGGCGKEKTAWEHPGCDDYCTLENCGDLSVPCGECSDEDCALVSNVCGAKRPYACTAGASKGGCSDEASYWPNGAFNGICSKCCDVSTCPGLVCTTCTEEECEEFACSAKLPFACTSGAAAKGCGGKTYWQGPAGASCDACCDTSNCTMSSTTLLN